MGAPNIKDLTRAAFLIIMLKDCYCEEVVTCGKTPLGIQTSPLPPDDRFAIEIEMIGIDNLYIPKQDYTIRLYSKNNHSTFIAFTIFAVEDTIVDEKNPGKKILLNAGQIIPSPDGNDVKPCDNTSVVQSNITPKKSVKAIWKAPDKDQKCVTISAVVAISKDVWYSYEGPLSKYVCEDHRNLEDIQPKQNDNCRVCEDARYRLTFEGMWSYNTHPLMFPESRELARFSDVVGASHGNTFNLYKYNTAASDGLRMLALQGNTTKLEMEIQKKIGKEVRSIIKATGPPKPNLSSSSTFRAGRHHHFVSLLVAIIPSPDWFLGVANLELCNSETNYWSESIRLNLYPLDAGVDSGSTFESPNEETSPPRAISEAKIGREKEKSKPLAKLHFDLIRTYKTTDCENESPESYSTEDNEISSPESSSEVPPPVVDPDSSADCPLSEWDDWMVCEGGCDADKKIRGYHTRFRYYIVDGVAVGKSNQGSAEAVEVPKECEEQYSEELTDTEPCEVDCEEEEAAEET